MRVVDIFSALTLSITLLGGCGASGGEGGTTSGSGTDTDAGTATDTGGGPDESDALFDPDHVVEIDIQLPETDWDALRVQTRELDVLIGECQAQPFMSPFTYFPAMVTVDGVTMDPVGVRKKGFLGSLDEDKPSLKLDFQEYVPDVTAHGVRRMTLNNSKQDPSAIRQCLVYQLFNDAGLVAPRCNFAHVTVNGEDKGVYVNVEPVKKPFLARRFTSDAGNLYEGTLSDFREGWTTTFEKKTNKTVPDQSDIDGLTSAVDGPDDGLVDRLAAEMDVDQFMDFWAMEVLVGHWDGYAGNTNNFFVYRDPADDRFRFLPWGVDGVLGVDPSQPPHSVMASGVLAHRLYDIGTTRDQYRARMQAMLDEVWREDELLAEIDRMESLVLPIGGHVFTDDLSGSIDQLRTFVTERRGQIQSELDVAAPAWEEELRNSACLAQTGFVDMQFDTTWGTLDVPDPFTVGTAMLDAEYFGQPLTVDALGAQAGLVMDEEGTRAEVRVVAMLDTGEVAFVVVNMPPPLFTPATYPVEFGEVGGAAVLLDPALGEEGVTIVGLLFGELVLTAASQTDGEAVTGSFVGDILYFGA